MHYFTIAIKYDEYYGEESELVWFSTSLMATEPVAEIKIDSVSQNFQHNYLIGY